VQDRTIRLVAALLLVIVVILGATAIFAPKLVVAVAVLFVTLASIYAIVAIFARIR
jgi:hypothetical protein